MSALRERIARALVQALTPNTHEGALVIDSFNECERVAAHLADAVLAVLATDESAAEARCPTCGSGKRNWHYVLRRLDGTEEPCPDPWHSSAASEGGTPT